MPSEIVYVVISWNPDQHSLVEIKVFKNQKAAYDYKDYILKNNDCVRAQVFPKVTED